VPEGEREVPVEGEEGKSSSMAIAPQDLDRRSPERDRRLVEAHQAGDPDAFAGIVADHYPTLLAQAERRLGSRVEAEDVVQEVFERALRAIDRFGGDYRLAAWLSLITSNVCATHGARRTSQRQLPERLAGDQLVTPDWSDVVSDPVVLETVLSAIDRLPRSQRSSFVLHAVDGLPYPDVADQLGITEANARARVHRARVTLQRRLRGVRSLLGAVVGAPLAVHTVLRHLPGRLAHVGPLHGTGSSPAVATASGAAPAAPTAGQALARLHQSVNQLAVQVATSPQAQAAVTGAPNPRGSLLAVVAGVAAVATATFSPGPAATAAAGGTPAATRAAPARVSPTHDFGASRSRAGSSSAPVTMSVIAETAPAPAPAPAPAVSPATTNGGTSPAVHAETAPSPATTNGGTSAAVHVPSWVALASATQPSKTPTSSGTPVGGTGAGTGSGAGAVGAPVGTSVATNPAVAPCPWLAAFPGATPGPIPTAPPLSGTVVDLLETRPVTLANVSTDPVFHGSATLTTPTADTPGTAVSVLTGACVAPASGVLVVDVTAADGTEVQLRGVLASTTGTTGDPGYLFRGTTVVLSKQAPTASSTSAASLPWGISADFVAQLLLRTADNTAQLALAFVEPPEGGGAPTASSTPTAASPHPSIPPSPSPSSSAVTPASDDSTATGQVGPTTGADPTAFGPRRPR
jgi:RNA polymerase sigma-70 factor (ECF subfamily)